jgi:hypothetical protein
VRRGMNHLAFWECGSRRSAPDLLYLRNAVLTGA